MQDLRNASQATQDNRNTTQAAHAPARHGFYQGDRAPFPPQDVRSAALENNGYPGTNNGYPGITAYDN